MAGSCDPVFATSRTGSNCCCSTGSAADSDLLCLHHHRRPDGRRHHPVPHPHRHVIHGGDQTQLFRGLLVHPPPLHHFLRRPRLPRSWVRERRPLASTWLECCCRECQTGFTRGFFCGFFCCFLQTHCEESTGDRSTTQHQLL